MSRSCPYRREISDACNWHQDQALNSNMYILSQSGPTGFTIKEENETKNYKVFLGDVHNCTCPVFKKEKDLCAHICFILLKKFKVIRTDERSWQLGLNEREINQIIRGDAANDSQSKKSAQKGKIQADAANPSSKLQQREITDVDCCPICQDELLNKKLPVTFCRFGCGNNVHIQCMKVYADHQKSNGETQLKCPLCRETFSSFENLDIEYRNNGLFKAVKQDLHYGLVCKNCNSTPISGKCYKCTRCNEFHLCQACFNTDFHKEHDFVYREKVTSKYLKANRENVGLIPLTIANHLANRDLNEQDYELLLQLDERNNAAAANNFSTLTEKIIKTWPSERVRENGTLLQPGYQCRICLRAYTLNQVVRKLPGCKHKFHVECIDNWLIHSHPTCPIDGQVVWDETAAQMEKEELKSKQKSAQNQKTLPISNSANKLTDLGSLSLIINSKTCFIENKQPNSASTSGHSKITLKKKTPSDKLMNSDKKLDIGIKIEGRNPSANFLDDLDDYTNSLALAQNIVNSQPKTEDNKTIVKRKMNPIKSSQSLNHQKEPNSIPTKSQLPQIPHIEVKGNKINDNQFATTCIKNQNMNMLTLNQLRVNETRDDILFKKTGIKMNDAYNMPGFSRPYQLSKPKSSNSRTSDFNKVTYSDVEDDNECFENLNYLLLNQSNQESILSKNLNNLELDKIKDKISNPDDFISINCQNNTEQHQKVVTKQKLRTHHPPMLNKNNLIDLIEKQNNSSFTNNLPLVTGFPLDTKRQIDNTSNLSDNCILIDNTKVDNKSLM